MIDAPRGVRQGEALDEAKLADWLRSELDLEGELTIEQFPAGHSNLVYAVTIGERELVLRRPPFGNRVKSAHDVLREFEILMAIDGRFPVPSPIASCPDPSVLGAPFYVMERLRGVVLRRSLPAGVTVAPALAQRLAETLIDQLATLHALDWRAAGLGNLGKPDGYVERQVTGWTKRWVDSRTEDVPDVDRAAAWLAENRPWQSPRVALLHNDFKYDNVVWSAGFPDELKVIGVLDWEMSTLGDPLMDLGTALGYWVEAGDGPGLQALSFGPTAIAGSPSRRALAERYARATGADLARIDFYYCFALFKLTVVLQQIYARYVRGATSDTRFAGLGEGVKILGGLAAQACISGMP